MRSFSSLSIDPAPPPAVASRLTGGAAVDAIRPIQIGSRAPDFTLPLVDGDRPVSLADYRGKSPLLIGLFRGIYCAFCRRAVARLGHTGKRLRPLGVGTLAVVGTKLENARLCWVGGGPPQRRASVRRSNCTCGFPACSFHEVAARGRGLKDGISETRLTSPNSPRSRRVGSIFHPVQRHRLYRWDHSRRTTHRSSWLKSLRT
jgi:hypothetical protein